MYHSPSQELQLVVANPLRDTPAGKQAEIFHVTFSLARTLFFFFSGSRTECVDRVLTHPGRNCCISSATPRALFHFESGVTGPSLGGCGGLRTLRPAGRTPVR